MSDGATLAIPRGFTRQRRQGGVEGIRIARHGRAGGRSAVCGGRNIHDQPRVRRPGEVVPGSPPRGRHPGDRDQFGQRQCGDRRARVWRTPGARRSVPATLLGCRPEQVLVASTGIIGHQLAMDKIEAGIAEAVAGLSAAPEAFQTAAASIMTTDTRPKIVSQRQTIAGREVTLLGIAKGAAMIGPRMATMLGFLLTDAPLWANDLQDILPMRSSIRSTACRSRGTPVPMTPSSCCRARLRPTRSCRGTTSGRLPRWCARHARRWRRAIADDGEGATHFITIDVEGCETFEDARAIARAVADSPLVKTAIHGADPNWGRIVSAAGYSGCRFRGRGALPLDQRCAGLPERHAGSL